MFLIPKKNHKFFLKKIPNCAQNKMSNNAVVPVVPMSPQSPDSHATVPLSTLVSTSSVGTTVPPTPGTSSSVTTVPGTPPVSGTVTNPINLVTPTTAERTPDNDPQHSNWTITINYDGTKANGEAQIVEAVAIHLANEIGKTALYAVFGREVAPTTGQKHLQAFACFKNKTRLSTLRRKFHKEIHWEPMGADVQYNYEYCTKTGRFADKGPGDPNPLIFGQAPNKVHPGEREADRWKKARQSAELGKFDEIDDQIYVQNFKSIIGIRAYACNTQEWLDAPCGFWFYGPPGTGKSYAARTKFRDGGVYIKQPNKWWCNYNGEETVVIEDLDLSHAYLLGYLKIWTDRYPFPAEIKGANVKNIRPKRIVITSNHAVEQVFPIGPDLSEDDQKALLRRFKRTYFAFKYVDTMSYQDEDADKPSVMEGRPRESNFVTPPPLVRSVSIVPNAPARLHLRDPDAADDEHLLEGSQAPDC